MTIYKSIFLFCICILCCSSINAQLVINEILSDNDKTIQSSDGEYYDYLEIYNATGLPINISGYYLSDDQDDLTKWKIPNFEIQNHDFLLVFCSGNDEIVNNELHTNFKISSSGEKLFLSDNLGNLIDQSPLEELDEDQSFGRIPDGSDQWHILHSPSPGEPNSDQDILILSHDAGYYNQSIDLTITSALGMHIRYTTDGSIPTHDSELYPGTLSLSDKTFTPNIWSEIPSSPSQNLISNHAWQSPGHLVDKAHTLRFASFIDNEIASHIYTKSYLIAEDVGTKYNLPVISLITDPRHLFDSENGIYIPGASYDSDDPEWTGNYFLDGIESERPIHIEYFEKGGSLGFAQDAGIRIHGGKTRHAAQKSLKLYARSEYSKKHFNYKLMPQNDHDKYKRFVLRTTMGAWGGESVIKDVLAHEMVRDLDFEKQDYHPVIVFINGEYWGIQTIRDRADEHYLSYRSGLDSDSIFMAPEWNHGYDGLSTYIDDNAPIDDDEYEYISSKIDISSFIDYNIAQMYLKNYDWPANNNQHWKPKFSDDPWRWIFFDVDAGFGDYEYNMLEHNTEDDPEISWPTGPKFTQLFRALIDNHLFLDRFIERYVHLLKSDFLATAVLDKLDTIIQQYEGNMPTHISRWHFPRSMDGWTSDIDEDIIDFIKNRPCYVEQNLKDFFQLQHLDLDCTEYSSNGSIPNIEISITPNPTFDVINIRSDQSETINGSYNIIKSTGKKVSNWTQFQLNTGSNHQINIEEYPTGVYILSLLIDDVVFSSRVIKL